MERQRDRLAKLPSSKARSATVAKSNFLGSKPRSATVEKADSLSSKSKIATVANPRALGSKSMSATVVVLVGIARIESLALDLLTHVGRPDLASPASATRVSREINKQFSGEQLPFLGRTTSNSREKRKYFSRETKVFLGRIVSISREKWMFPSEGGH